MVLVTSLKKYWNMEILDKNNIRVCFDYSQRVSHVKCSVRNWCSPSQLNYA